MRLPTPSLCSLALSALLLSALANAATPAPAGGTSVDKAAAPKSPVAAALKLEPKALDVLKAASARLAAARTMAFTAVVSYESPSVFGPPLVYTTRSDVTLQRPDKLRVITPGDGPATEFYYDGKTMAAFAPAENLLATAVAPATIDATLAAAFDSASIYFPFSDLIVADPYKDLAEGMEVAFYIGQSKEVGGITTDMVAFANSNVFVQIWVGADDKLPRKLRAVYLHDPLMLRHDMDVSNWVLDPKVEAGSFSPAKAASAMKIAFARPDSMPANTSAPPPIPPPTAPKSTKTP